MFKNVLFILVLVGFFPIHSYSGGCDININAKTKTKNPHSIVINSIEETTKRLGVKKKPEITVENITGPYTNESIRKGYTSQKSCNRKRQLKMKVTCVKCTNNNSICYDKNTKTYICPRSKGPNAFGKRNQINFNCKDISSHCSNELK